MFLFFVFVFVRIFNANGENWRVQRKTASKMFSRRVFTTFMAETFAHHGHTVLEILDEAVQTQKTMNMQDLFYQFTLDSIGQIGFGVDLGVLRKGKIPFSEAFDQAQAEIPNRVTNPFWRLTGWFTGTHLRHWGNVAIMNKFAREVIQNRKSEGVKDKADILSFFMERTDENGQPFSEKYLTDIVINFLVAGRDTTAVTLSWAFYALATEPEVEKNLLEELDSVLRGKEPTYEDVDTRMPYLHAFIKEVLRLYPPVPKDPKTAVNDDILPDGTFVPAGTEVVFVPYVMGRMEELYENPLKFDPERWFKPENAKKTLFEYPVFQAGPRTCLGMSMALFEAKVLTAMILQRFVARVEPGFIALPGESITMPIVGGLPVTIQKRKDFYYNITRTKSAVDIVNIPVVGGASDEI